MDVVKFELIGLTHIISGEMLFAGGGWDPPPVSRPNNKKGQAP
jgi:hypothetical protein